MVQCALAGGRWRLRLAFASVLLVQISCGTWLSELALLEHIQRLREGNTSDEAHPPSLTPLSRDFEILETTQHCISQSWWTAARELVARKHALDAERHNEAGIAPIKYEIIAHLEDAKRQADSFAVFADKIYRGQTEGIDVQVHCALQWAQNSTTIFLSVKYAARWSAPGAIEVVDLDVNISAHELHLNGFGHHSDIRKRYSVDLDLYGAVLPNPQSYWSTGSVGRMTVHLEKKQPGRWTRLTKSKDKGSHPITQWLDMEERWADEMANAAIVKDRTETDVDDHDDHLSKLASKMRDLHKGVPTVVTNTSQVDDHVSKLASTLRDRSRGPDHVEKIKNTSEVDDHVAKLAATMRNRSRASAGDNASELVQTEKGDNSTDKVEDNKIEEPKITAADKERKKAKQPNDHLQKESTRENTKRVSAPVGTRSRSMIGPVCCLIGLLLVAAAGIGLACSGVQTMEEDEKMRQETERRRKDHPI